MGQLDDFSLDQVAGASALVISSIGGLFLILFKSRCRRISCFFGLLACDRVVQSDDEEEPNKDKETSKKEVSDQENLNNDEIIPVIDQ
tara:strand:+ start:424 stop:687 length:264 start_codon:yes stop_codon:yes gene_type:complete